MNLKEGRGRRAERGPTDGARTGAWSFVRSLFRHLKKRENPRGLAAPRTEAGDGDWGSG